MTSESDTGEDERHSGQQLQPVPPGGMYLPGQLSSVHHMQFSIMGPTHAISQWTGG